MTAISARFDDLTSDTAWVFGMPHETITAHCLGDVRGVLRAVDVATRAGAWAWGYVSYEAAPAFDSALRVRTADAEGPPLACFAIGPAPSIEPAIRLPDDDPVRPRIAHMPGLEHVPATEVTADTDNTSGTGVLGAWRCAWTKEQHAAGVERARTTIAAGTTYQVNLTTELRRAFDGDPLALYARLAHAQRGAYHAYLDICAGHAIDQSPGRHVIASASPELFFRWDEDGITTRPMKGTARRGTTNDEDGRIRAALTASAKQRAENVMIVDLLRNDLARIAEVGSVRVPTLLRPERYDTVWQLTSDITARPRADVGLEDVFAALFPCGSVTGAPKVAAMGVIADLETSPRGVYCGAIGMVAPPGSPFRARFSVAIRTAVIDRAGRTAGYGTGGAVTWHSNPRDEYDEMLAKARILDEQPGDFQLLETLRFDPATGLRNLDRHLARLVDSARYFGIPADLTEIRARLTSMVEDMAESTAAAFPHDTEPDTLPSTKGSIHRVRLLLSRTGWLTVEHAPFVLSDTPVTLALDTRPTVTGRWTRHKTTRRDHYDAAAARHPQADDVILVDESGHALETTRANLAALIDGRWCTPTASRGCLPGVERQRLIEAGVLRERDITAAELRESSGLAVVSSLRGWRLATLLPPTRPSA